MKHPIELTPESEDEIVVNVLKASLVNLCDGMPRIDEQDLIKSLEKVIGYFEVQR